MRSSSSAGSSKTRNLLPCDGEVRYLGPVLAAEEADEFLRALLAGIAWRHDELVMFGRRIVTSREVAWHGDEPFEYRYSGTAHRALPWTEDLGRLRDLVERRTGASFNSCLLNLYHDGGEGMGWHSDDEATLVPRAPIASLSLGAERRFDFRHRRERNRKISVVLEHGSLLVMGGETQRHWHHALPKTKRVTEARINLTFRRMCAESAARRPEAG